jgi:hypothetical protein
MPAPAEESPPPVAHRRRERIAVLLVVVAGLMVLAGAWREVRDHHGVLLAVIPAAIMPILAAWLARQAARRGKRS